MPSPTSSATAQADPAATRARLRLAGRQRRGPGRWALLAMQVGALIAVLVIWQISVMTGLVNEFLIPAPLSILSQVWTDVVSLFTGGAMFGHFFTTLSETVIGFLAAAVFAIGLGILISEFTLFGKIVYPYVIALSATPRIAFAPLFIIWFGFDLSSKVVMVASIAAFPILVNCIAGFQAADASTLKLMRSLGATRMQTFRKVKVRTSLPFIFAGMESGIIFAVVGAVVAEFTSGNRGLGYLTLVGQELFNLPLAFSAIILLSLQGVMLHGIIVFARRRIIFWQRGTSESKAA